MEADRAEIERLARLEFEVCGGPAGATDEESYILGYIHGYEVASLHTDEEKAKSPEPSNA